MSDLTHGFKIDEEKCDGRMHCMRACPTHAIRVTNGKAHVVSERCIDCGICLSVCPTGAISATTIAFAELSRYKYTVAVASPALFTQFGMNDTPDKIARALRELGFDAVWEYAVDIELVDRAISDIVRNWSGPFPLISSSCPVIVRLIQVAYPTMINHLISVNAPRELAGRELKRRYSEELGLKPEEIAAIYITPCQAKTISILQPAEEAKSFLDGAVGISQIYNDILFRLRNNSCGEPAKGPEASGELFHWVHPEGEFPMLSTENYLPLMGLPNVIRVFDDIEKGKIRNISFLECHCCQGGCIGGNLAVENVYIARSKNLRLIGMAQKYDPEFEKEVDRRYVIENLRMRAPIHPRIIEGETIDLRERVLRKKRTDELFRSLPLLNCGLCGAPTCKNHAEDVTAGRAEVHDCIFLSRDRIDILRETYLKKHDS
jgi:iron only hydrogenase large subunit-like protein